jgi:hypothetical protein
VSSDPVHVESGPSSDSSKEPFSGPSPKLNRLIDNVRSLEQWYAADFERRVASLTEILKNQITEELKSQFSSELNAHVERARSQFEERFYTQASQWQLQRESLEKELEELRRKLPGNDVLKEIAAMEAAVSKYTNRGSLEVEGLTLNAGSLGKLLQGAVEELETKAYLRGLKFRLPNTGA